MNMINNLGIIEHRIKITSNAGTSYGVIKRNRVIKTCSIDAVLEAREAIMNIVS